MNGSMVPKINGGSDELDLPNVVSYLIVYIYIYIYETVQRTHTNV